MGQTHPNAFRVEAEKKRAAGNHLLAEAEALERQAAKLSGEPLPEAGKIEKVKSVGVKKADILAIAEAEGVEGFDENSKIKDIADVINAKRGVA